MIVFSWNIVAGELVRSLRFRHDELGVSICRKSMPTHVQDEYLAVSRPFHRHVLGEPIPGDLPEPH
eukprot:366212-Chlamydomonas_euryale.AAC.48